MIANRASAPRMKNFLDGSSCRYQGNGVALELVPVLFRILSHPLHLGHAGPRLPSDYIAGDQFFQKIGYHFSFELRV